MLNVLFVCTGNTCRSPMAEALAREKADRGWDGKVEFSSAGTLDLESSPASPLAVEVLSEIGIDLNTHRSTHLNEEIIKSADLIVAMAQRHKDVITMMVPDAEARVILLGELDPQREEADIRDPIGGDREIYRQARDDLQSLIGPLFDHIRERFDPGGR